MARNERLFCEKNKKRKNHYFQKNKMNSANSKTPAGASRVPTTGVALNRGILQAMEENKGATLDYLRYLSSHTEDATKPYGSKKKTDK